MDGWMEGLNSKEEDKKWRIHTWQKDRGRQPFSYMHINMCLPLHGSMLMYIENIDLTYYRQICLFH